MSGPHREAEDERAGDSRSRRHDAHHFASSPETGGLATRLAAQRLKRAGISLEPLLRQARVTAAQIDKLDTPITVVSQIAFLELAAKALDDEFLGFRLALDVDLRKIGLLYYVMDSSGTLGEALERAARYNSLANAGVVMSCVAAKGLVARFRFVGVSRHRDRQQVECLMMTTVRLCRALTNRRLVPRAMRLVHRCSGDPSEFERFLSCRITFGADADEIVFAREAGSLPLVGADPYLNQILLRSCEDALSHRRSNAISLRASIENAITPLLPHGKAHLKAVANQLGMSVRTLSRRLNQEDLTFPEILHQLRTDLALHYLRDQSLSISQIAWLVGYGNVSSFSHACKRWTGMNPARMRDRLLTERSLR
jgi:AraC-like DNA-binding protein